MKPHKVQASYQRLGLMCAARKRDNLRMIHMVSFDLEMKAFCLNSSNSNVSVCIDNVQIFKVSLKGSTSAFS